MNSAGVTGWSHLCTALKDETQKWVAGVPVDRGYQAGRMRWKMYAEELCGECSSFILSFVL